MKILLTLLIFVSVFCSAQEWKTDLFLEGNGEAGDIIRMENGLIYFVATVENDGNADILLACLDPSGKILWEKIFPGERDDFAESMIMYRGKLLICGRETEKSTAASSGLLLTADTAGNLVERKVVEKAGRNVIFKCAIELMDGDLAVVGYMTQADLGANDYYLQVYSKEGSVTLDTTYGTQLNDAGCKIVEGKSGKLIISGDSEGMDGYYDILTIGVERNGDLVWEYRQDDVFNTGMKDMILLRGGDVLIAGEGSGPGSPYFDLVLLQVSPEGELVSRRTFGKGGGEAIFSILEGENGEMHLTGYSSSYSEDFHYSTILGKLRPGADVVDIKYLYRETPGIGKRIVAAGEAFLVAATTSFKPTVISTISADFDDSFPIVTEEVSVSEVNFEKLRVYPNPFSESLRLPSGAELMDMTGRVLLISDGKLLDTSMLSSGLYVVRLGQNTTKVSKP